VAGKRVRLSMITTRDNQPALLTRVSTWLTVLMLTYFCMLGISPFLHNTNVQWRMADSSGEDSVAEHIFTYLICLTSVSLFLKSPRRVWRRFSSVPWIAVCPFLAIMSSLWSETPAKTLRAGVILGQRTSQRSTPSENRWCYCLPRASS
jgi:hypothetical protein